MLSGWGPHHRAVAPTFSFQPGSAALGCAGLAVRLAVLVALVAGLLTTVGWLAAAGLTALAAGATTHGTTHPGRQCRGRPRGRAARRRCHRVLLSLSEPQQVKSLVVV